MLMLKEH
jgi:hypothetical protein